MEESPDEFEARIYAKNYFENDSKLSNSFHGLPICRPVLWLSFVWSTYYVILVTVLVMICLEWYMSCILLINITVD